MEELAITAVERQATCTSRPGSIGQLMTFFILNMHLSILKVSSVFFFLYIIYLKMCIYLFYVKIRTDM